MVSLAQQARSLALREVGQETIVREGIAGWLKCWEGVGGWLLLTPDWLVFAAHPYNWHKGRLLLPMASITSVRAEWSRLFGKIPLLPNVVRLTTESGREYRFVVFKRNAWVQSIRQLMTNVH